MARIGLGQITKRFGASVAVNRFDLTVLDGEFVALVGPSGCGKTTTLRMLAGLEAVDEGRITVGGRDVTHLPPRARNLAMVFQSYALYPHMSAERNIGFALELRGMARDEVARRVRAAAERLDIAHLLERRPGELSGGQRQRVAVARCIVREPDAFLFDEPLSNLDAKLRATARVEIARLQKGLGITTLYVTHDQVEAMTMADRVVLMEGGMIRQTGAPMDLYHDPHDIFVASFLGAPPMNLLAGEVVRTDSGPRFIAPALNLALPGAAGAATGPATLGLRPESLGLAPLPQGSIALQGTCLHVENLGAETLLRVVLREAPDAELIARIAGSASTVVGAEVTLNVSARALHLFDADGLSIRMQAAPRVIAFA